MGTDRNVSFTTLPDRWDYRLTFPARLRKGFFREGRHGVDGGCKRIATRSTFRRDLALGFGDAHSRPPEGGVSYSTCQAYS